MTEVVEREELITPGPAEALAKLLGVRGPDPVAGDRLPLLWHWVYLLERPAESDLGLDGHPVRGGIPEPPGEGWRRMFAGGRIQVSEPLRFHEVATRRTRVIATRQVTGRSGPLRFVTVGHELSQAGRVVIAEQQDIVYREETDETPPEVIAAPDAVPRVPLAEGEWPIDVTPTLLFRFSALTYNAHRIHYDRDYAREVDGYPGLVVHGPLQALAMTEAARARDPGLGEGAAFEYRLVAPLFDHQGLVAAAIPTDERIDTTVRDRTGRITARGTLTAIQPSDGAHHD